MPYSENPPFQGGWDDEFDRFGTRNPMDDKYDELREDVVYWATGLGPGESGYEEEALIIDYYLGESASPWDIADHYGHTQIIDFPWQEWEEWMGYK